ncbi:MAG TPA: hypothetical protein VGU20_23755 [Stellaceae bacterium]|nr:hypothetical protein [Stellaceae bacterium]
MAAITLRICLPINSALDLKAGIETAVRGFGDLPTKARSIRGAQRHGANYAVIPLGRR